MIYPRVDLGRFQPAGTPGDYDLMVNALSPYKRVDLAVEAFNKLGRERRIVGTGLDPLLGAVRFFEGHHRDFSSGVIRESVSRFGLPRFLAQFSQFVEEKAGSFLPSPP